MTLVGVRVEVWPLAADRAGIWSLAGSAPPCGDVLTARSGGPHAGVQNVLRDLGLLDDVVLLHSTSWRAQDDAVVLTYLAVVAPAGRPAGGPDPVLVDLDHALAAGRPAAHGAVEAPAPRELDVLLHGIRHLRFLLDTDAASRAALDDWWHKHLVALEPALATMYEVGGEAAASS